MMRTPPRTRSRSASETRSQPEPSNLGLSDVTTEEIRHELIASLDVLNSAGQLMPPPPVCTQEIGVIANLAAAATSVPSVTSAIVPSAVNSIPNTSAGDCVTTTIFTMAGQQVVPVSTTANLAMGISWPTDQPVVSASIPSFTMMSPSMIAERGGRRLTPSPAIQPFMTQIPSSNIAAVGIDEELARTNKEIALFEARERLAALRASVARAELECAATSNVSMAMVKRKIKTSDVEPLVSCFSGDDDYEVNKWISDFEHVMESLLADDGDRYRMGRHLLKGTASVYSSC